jgi:uncharacterized delta-60 repeat protein
MRKQLSSIAAAAAFALVGTATVRAGDLDTSFGSSGVVRTDVGGWDSATDILLQADGKIVVTGLRDADGQRNSFLVRYNSDGTLDVSFGGSGTVVPARATGVYPRLAQQPDGKILLGTRSDEAAAGLLVLRFQADGAPDPTFGAAGAALIPSMFVSSIAGIAVAPDGAIVVGARLSGFSGEQIGIARFGADGQPDETFGEGGLLAVESPYSWLALALAMDDSGRILIGGYVFGLPGRFFTDAFVSRFEPDGTLDGSFGTGGVVLIQPDTGTEVQSLALQTDGKILAGGRLWGPEYYQSRWLLARFDENGIPDAQFGSGGRVEFDASTGHDVILGIAVSDAGIHVAGQTETLEKGLAAARFLENGSLDTGFGPGGLTGAAGVPATGYNRLVVQPDGKVVVAGSGVVFEPVFAVDVFVARYSAESLPDTAPPVLVVPPPLAVDATTPAGAVVTYVVSASDDQDPAPIVACMPASGTTFAIGDTLVTCLATDNAGNSQSAAFNVHVKGAGEQLAELEQAVSGVGPGQSLAAKVRQARSLLSRGDAAGTARVLRAFVAEVNAQSGKSLDASQAASLVATAKRIAAVLGQSI